MAPTVSSSVYSQHYDWNDKTDRPRAPSSYYGNVSPPDSPIESQRRNSGDVSPIENDIERDIHPAFRIRQQKSPVSNIPVARKAAPTSTTTLTSRAYQRDPSKPTKWDKYSGEPTTSEKGMPHRVKPEAVVEDIEKIKLKSTSSPTESDAETVVAVNTRPPWRGASGRHTIVDPVVDKPGQQVPVPRREVNKPDRIRTVHSPSISAEHLLPSPKSTVADIASSHTPTDTIRPNPMRQGPGSTNTHSLSAKGSNDTMRKFTPSTADDDRSHTPTNAGISGGPEEQTPTRSGRVIDSRFSWTTQASNTTYQHSPPSSPVPPLPTMPKNSTSLSVNTSSSIMNRTRPIPSNRNYDPAPDSPVSSVTPTVRRPIGGLRAEGQERQFPARKSSYAVSIASTTTTSGGKALPRTPQELNSQDHVSALQAQMADLTTQRNNVERVLRDLTAPGASNPLTTNFRVEREREKRIQALRDELNEIGLQEHDIGLKLHRAQRRREEDEGYEGFTTLWVRRVTGGE